jgi:histidinol dehydrogenase
MTTLGYYDTQDNKKRLEKLKPKDTIVESVIEQFKQRSEAGIKKYNTTLDREDLTRLEWLQHAQEEAMDLILYLEKLKQYEK